MGILLLVDSFLLMGCVFLLSAWFLLSVYIHVAGVFMLPIHQFMLLAGFAVPDTAGGTLGTNVTASTIPTSAAMDSAGSHH
ncbi:hypothetical protein Tco_0503981, partial [Tanacetum coccineum]